MLCEDKLGVRILPKNKKWQGFLICVSLLFQTGEKSGDVGKIF